MLGEGDDQDCLAKERAHRWRKVSDFGEIGGVQRVVGDGPAQRTNEGLAEAKVENCLEGRANDRASMITVQRIRRAHDLEERVGFGENGFGLLEEFREDLPEGGETVMTGAEVIKYSAWELNEFGGERGGTLDGGIDQ